MLARESLRVARLSDPQPGPAFEERVNGAFTVSQRARPSMTIGRGILCDLAPLMSLDEAGDPLEIVQNTVKLINHCPVSPMAWIIGLDDFLDSRSLEILGQRVRRSGCHGSDRQ